MNASQQIIENFPKIVIVDGKSYKIQYSQGMDASVLAEYEDIVFKARNGLEKSLETCQAVNNIHDNLVLRLHFINSQSYLEREQRMSNRGVIQRAKFTIAKIWMEAKQGSDEYHCPKCGYEGRVNFEINRLFPCAQCRTRIDFRDEVNDELL